MDRVEKQAALFNLPETIVPHSVLALGYPAKENKEPRESRYEENRVHFEKWYQKTLPRWAASFSHTLLCSVPS